MIKLTQKTIDVNFDLKEASFKKDETGQCTLALCYKIAGESKEILLSGLELNSFIAEFSRVNIINSILIREGYATVTQQEAESLFLNS